MFPSRRLASIRGLLFSAVCTFAFSAAAEVEHVILISVDGLRGDFLRTFIETTPAEFPNLVRLRDRSAITYNARCDLTHSITIPNHLSMLTARPVSQFAGGSGGVKLHHGYTNDSPEPTDTVHAQGNPAVPYKVSIFDMVHDRGRSTALYVGKNRLAICERSYNAEFGAPDLIGADNGPNKIDYAQISESNTPALLATLLTHIANSLETFTLFHIAETDYAGHASGWTTASGPYRDAVKVADGQLGQILDAVAAQPALNGKVAFILTADHGGGGTFLATHTDARSVGNVRIPLFVSAPGMTGGNDLHSYFLNRTDPGVQLPGYSPNVPQPMRNLDVGNLAAALLGLPAIPGSTLIPEWKKPIVLVPDREHLFVTWPAYLTGYTLESRSDLKSGAWKIVSEVVEAGAEMRFEVPKPLANAGFFRLRRPADQPANPAPAARAVKKSKRR